VIRSPWFWWPLFVLDADERPVACHDLDKWAEHRRDDPRVYVGNDVYGEYRVSTVFMGTCAYEFDDADRPILWETIVSRAGAPLTAERYASADDARAGHDRWTRRVAGKVPS